MPPRPPIKKTDPEESGSILKKLVAISTVIGTLAGAFQIYLHYKEQRSEQAYLIYQNAQNHYAEAKKQKTNARR